MHRRRGARGCQLKPLALAKVRRPDRNRIPPQREIRECEAAVFIDDGLQAQVILRP